MSKPQVVNESLLMTAAHVNSSMLLSKIGQTVRLIATVLASSNGRVDVEASDGGRLVVTITSGAEVVPGQVYQFIGRAVSATEFHEVSSLEWGNLNMKNFDAMLQLQGQYPGLFHE